MQWLRLYGGPDVIICGDFNDVPGCHAIRTFADAGFHSVYPSIGFGPMITYNARHLYFCIDHVLYRGALTPLYISKGTLKTSDHYPLTPAWSPCQRCGIFDFNIEKFAAVDILLRPDCFGHL